MVVFFRKLDLRRAHFSFKQNNKYNKELLKRSSDNIQSYISELFGYSNRINSYIGNQIIEHDPKDLDFIFSLFREIDKMSLFSTINGKSELLSWTSFDWVAPNNLQTVNSRLGIRKNPPNMSARQYTKTSKEKPWKLQVSFPVLGNPSEVWVIPAGTGITDDKNKFLGIVVVGFNISELTSKIQQKINNNVSFVVLDKDFNIVLQSRDNKKEHNDDFYKKNIDISFPKPTENLEEPILVDDIIYRHYQKMDDYPYIILTGFNQNFLSKEFNNLILPHILEFILISIFFLIILYILKTKITSLLIAEQNLTKSLNLINQTKTRLIRAASHDLRNYIFGISGLAKLILEKKPKSKVGDDDLQLTKIIAEQADEMGNFVEDLLDTNQNETGKFSLGRIEECDIAELAQRMVLLNKNQSLKSQVDIQIEAEKNLPKLNCNERRIKQIFNNLITNSIKYSTANTAINITIKQIKNPKQIYIEFKDQGIGMDEEEIKMALAGDGVSIDKSILNKPIDSHGIGLPVVKHLVDFHNGTIEIQSRKGKGTKIKLYFPITEVKAAKDVKTDLKSNSTTNFNPKNKTILLVEDNPVNIKITSRILENAGLKIKSATNGKEALKILDEEKFDLILMDGEMPIMNGYETTKKIREGNCFKKFKNYKTIPIIALMGNSDPITIRQTQDCGMDGHIVKSTGNFLG